MRFKEKLLPGRTGMLSVVAFDKIGRRVGTTLTADPFLWPDDLENKLNCEGGLMVNVLPILFAIATDPAN
jgi:hypothetical protein